MSSPVVSVVVPVFNELRTIDQLLARLVQTELDKELVLVDDCSTDGTREHLQRLATKGLAGIDAAPKGKTTLKIVFQEKNGGKGAALQRGFAEASGDIIIVQDADLEYDPWEIPRVVKPILDGRADVVFGSRFAGDERKVHAYWHAMVNWGLTTISNMTTGLALTDMETCYKAFRADLLKSFTLREKRFGIEPELTAHVARARVRVFEVPISYNGRSHEEGKKIGWKDGVRALWVIAREATRR